MGIPTVYYIVLLYSPDCNASVTFFFFFVHFPPKNIPFYRFKKIIPVHNVFSYISHLHLSMQRAHKDDVFSFHSAFFETEKISFMFMIHLLGHNSSIE